MSTDAPVKSKPNILKILIYFVAGVIVMTTAVTNLLVVWVMFAPDNLWKPIYLVYQLPVGTGEGGEVGVTSGGENPLHASTGEPAAGTVSGGTAESSGHTAAAPEGGAAAEAIPGNGIMIDTGTKIVNLAEPGGKKFIRVTATLEFVPPAGYSSLPEAEKAAELATFMSEINSRIPVLEDTIVTLLSSKDFASVYSTEGKELLKKEIMDTVNSRLPEFKVIYVYFKEFVVQ
ncbi:MAG: flagellar basal body-associated FliL family protein [Leptolinea sp.]